MAKQELETKLWTAAQVAERYGLTAKTLANWRWLGRGPRHILIGRQPRYPESALIAWERERRAVGDG